jgi:hypothetical protein
MGNYIFGIFMVFTGLLGLSATACGLYVLPNTALGLILVIPGVLLLWATVKMWTALKAPSSSPPIEQAPQSQRDRKENP